MNIENALVGALMVFCVYVWIWYFIIGTDHISCFLMGALFALCIADMKFNGLYAVARSLVILSAFFTMWAMGIYDKKIPHVNKTLNAINRKFNETNETKALGVKCIQPSKQSRKLEKRN